MPAHHGRGFDNLPPEIREVFLNALMASLGRDELLRALGCVIEALLGEVDEVQELAAKVEPQLRELTTTWNQ